MKERMLTAGGLLLAAVLLVAVNVLGSRVLSSSRIDLTENRLYTLSDGTRRVLASLDEPIELRLYLSRKLANRLPGVKSYAERVEALLEEYARASGGQVRVHRIDPEPFSEAEDRAVGYGLRGVPVGDGEDTFYFGLVGSGATGEESVIPYLSRDRARFLEYDITKLIYTLAHPDKQVVGVLTSLPLDGTGPAAVPGVGGTPPWAVMEQMRQLFDVRVLDKSLEAIPEDIDVLLLVHPKDLSEQARYAIDQYVLRGGHALVFVDPNAEADRGQAMGGMMLPPDSRSSDLGGLLAAWGLKLDTDKVVGDLRLAAKVRMQRGARMITFDYPVWMNVQPSGLADDDIVTGDLGNISFGTPGYLEPIEGATTTIKPLIETTDQATLFDVGQVAYSADPQELLRGYRPGGKRLALAVRVTGKVKSAFPDGPPRKKDADKEGAETAEGGETSAGEGEKKDAPPPHLAESSGEVNLIVVADTDLLQDRFWVNVQEFLGTRLAVPIASNGAFLINALDNLLGSNDLISVRNRGSFLRPFERVNDLRRAAEARFRDKEKELQARLKETEDKLLALQERKPGGQELVLTPEQVRELRQFRAEKLRIRKELREVRHRLRRDIDRLEAWTKFFNIGFVPLLIGIGGLLIGLWRMRRRRAALHAAAA